MDTKRKITKGMGDTLVGMADDTYTVQRSTTIEAPPERVFELIADFRNWTTWSPWEGIDPDMQRTYSGTESGVGAVYAWSGNRKAGRGRMQITDATEPRSVRIDLEFEKPWKARNDTLFTIDSEGTASRVTWSMTGRKTLMTKVMGLFTSMDKLVGPDFEKGLARLKTAVEKPATT
jgi:uncharacterized protein YndB with AHSA1/START domain